MTDSQDNNLPEIVDEISQDISFYNSSFYQRTTVDEIPRVAGRRIKPVGQCKLCSLVPTLMEQQDYTFYEAAAVEQDMYRFIYTFWSAEDIARWLKITHNCDIAHDSVSRHIKKHIIDPGTATIQRAISYRPDFMNKKFFTQMADTMKLYVMRYQAAVATGAIPVSTADFVNVIKLLKEWQSFLSEMQEDKTDMFMKAVGTAIEKTLEPYPDIKEEFISIFKEELEKIEKDDQE